MSELRNRTLAPPPPRHPTVKPPSPVPYSRSSSHSGTPPSVHPPLPPRPPPSPRPDTRTDHLGPEAVPSQAAAPLDASYTPHVQRVTPPVLPNRPGDPRSFSDNVVAFTSSVDVGPVETPIPPLEQPSIPLELPPPVSRASSFNSITSSTAIPPPVHHGGRAHSPVSDSAYEATLSEKELRDLYDDEEIDRFLRLFSTRVNEVKLNDGSQPTTNVETSASAGGVAVEDPEDNDGKDWVPLNGPGESLGLPRDGGQPQTISEQIALKFIVPYLPRTSHTIPPFTVNRLRFTTQRLYLTLEPGYQFIVDNLVSLAIWEDKNRSLCFCLGYWMLWANNLLLPSLIFYLLYVLLYRKMHPYPSLAQLREHRGHIDKASEFGEELQVRLTATTPLGLVDAWKTLRVYHKNKTHKAKEKMKQSDDTTSVMGIESDVAAADESVENTQEQGAKTLGLEALSELVDGLERLKNIFLWRKPSVSYAFGVVLGIIGLTTLALPAQWLAKITYFVLGFAFWHVPPILVAIPVGDHRRLVALMHNIPTDADYAMELIAERVAKGQEIKPLKRMRRNRKKVDANVSPDTLPRDLDEDGKSKGFLKQGVSVLKTVADTGYQAVGGQRFVHNNFAPTAVRDAGLHSNSRSYPAQHGTTSGVITVSTEKFYFTPLLKGSKLEVPVEDIVGIKKAMPKGVSIRIKDASQEDGERREKFVLVYERDELFGRLVGMGGKKWTRI